MLLQCLKPAYLHKVGALGRPCFLFRTGHRAGIHLASMRGAHTYEYPRPALTVDAVIVADGQVPLVLLIKRKNDPYAGSWALPGGFVDEGEDLDAAAARELEEETGLSAEASSLCQVAAFGEPGRDPRGWCVSVAYAARIPASAAVQGADDAEEAQWWPVEEVPRPLAFDHKLILRTAFRHLGAAHASMAPALLSAADGLEGPWQDRG